MLEACKDDGPWPQGTAQWDVLICPSRTARGKQSASTWAGPSSHACHDNIRFLVHLPTNALNLVIHLPQSQR